MLPDPSPARNWSFVIALVGILVLYLPWSLGGLYEFLEHRSLPVALLIHFLFDFIFAAALVELARVIWRIGSWSDKKHFTLVFFVWLALAVLSSIVFIGLRW